VSPPCNPMRPLESHCTSRHVSVNYHSPLYAPAYSCNLLYTPASIWIMGVLMGQPRHEGYPILEHKWKCSHNCPWLWSPHACVSAQLPQRSSWRVALVTTRHPPVSPDYISPYSSVALGTPYAPPSIGAPLLHHLHPLAMWLKDISESLLRYM
jgi:hypothetical protein